MSFINRKVLLSILRQKRILCKDVGADFDKNPMNWSVVLDDLSWDQLTDDQIAEFREELIDEAYDMAWDCGQTHECAGCEEPFFPGDTIHVHKMDDSVVMCEDCWDYFFNK